MQIHDKVKFLVDVPAQNVKAGQIGTVIGFGNGDLVAVKVAVAFDFKVFNISESVFIEKAAAKVEVKEVKEVKEEAKEEVKAEEVVEAKEEAKTEDVEAPVVKTSKKK